MKVGMIEQVLTVQRGFTLIEVLVSLLIFTIGLLGYGLLQHRSEAQLFNLEQRLVALHWVNNKANQMALLQTPRSNFGIPVEGLIGGRACIEWNETRKTYIITLVWRGSSTTRMPSCEDLPITGGVINRSISMADFDWVVDSE